MEIINKALAWAASVDPLMWCIIALWITVVFVYISLTTRIESLEGDVALNTEAIERIDERI